MEIEFDENYRIARPIGRLDANSSIDFEHAVSDFTDDGTDIIIDLSECPYMSSAGIRILLKINKKLQSAKHQLYLTGLVPAVYQVLEMAGLHKMLRIEPNVEAALAIIYTVCQTNSSEHEFLVDNLPFIFRSSTHAKETAQLCKSPEILSFKELGFAIGFGLLSESGTTGSNKIDFFISTGNCSCYLPMNQEPEADFIITSDPAKSGILVNEAISFGQQPSGVLQLNTPGKVSLPTLKSALNRLRVLALPDASVIFLVIANFDPVTPSVILALVNSHSFRQLVQHSGLNQFEKFIHKQDGSTDFVGFTFHLAEMVVPMAESSLQAIIQQQLTFENIASVEPVQQEIILANPMIWLFQADEFIEGKSKRLIIEKVSDFEFESSNAFLARLLYTDSSRLLVEPLHGGYSAQTFRVISFDHEGRKLRPTVMKIASRDLITRESERCKQYALPYIFNNSAVVLGAEYYGDTGALRYNFVGIGGEESQLKWLTHYYHHASMEVLEPLFDKIFLQILKPWYGQPVSKIIFPFRDHDPTFTFFAHIYQTVSELFSISSDEKFIRIRESERPILNPYWFLKHEYASRREESTAYFTAICHGDLNMQNILLDENMNVYLIDFSETKPRSIISDFARLEAIFLIDNAPLNDENDMADYLRFITGFYHSDRLNDIPEIVYTGRYRKSVFKNASLALKMRKYAFDCTNENPDTLPYYLALLEWVLPIVCYNSVSLDHKQLSMIVSSMLCERLLPATHNGVKY